MEEFRVVGHSAGLSQRSEKPSDIPPGCPNVRRNCRTFRRAVPTLGEAVGHSAGLSQRSEKPSDIPPDCPNARRSRRTFRLAVPTLGEAVGHSTWLSQRSEKPSGIPPDCPNARRPRRTVFLTFPVSEDVLHLLEEVAAQASRLVLQDEAAVRLHVGQAG